MCTNKRTASLFAADRAEQVLPIFEAAYPNDDRPRKAIAAARSVVSVAVARAAAFAAHAAARAATIHVATHAEHAAAYAAKARSVLKHG